MAELEKAYLVFEDRNNSKLPCLFNPEKITITKTNQWEDGERGESKAVPTLTFRGAMSGTMDFELFFDTTATGAAVTDYTNKLLARMEPSEDIPGRSDKLGNKRPPFVTLRWGRMYSFPSVIETATVNFEYFSATGVPLRARVTLKLKQYKPSTAFTNQNPTSGTPLPHRIHRVQRGETLDRISALYYGDATRWRMLAAANGIEDPLGIRPGSLISVPQLGS